jgi:hypothetical protein
MDFARKKRFLLSILMQIYCCPKRPKCAKCTGGTAAQILYSLRFLISAHEPPSKVKLSLTANLAYYFNPIFVL